MHEAFSPLTMKARERERGMNAKFLAVLRTPTTVGIPVEGIIRFVNETTKP